MIINYIKNIARIIIRNRRVITIARAIFSFSPYLEDRARSLAYRIKRMSGTTPLQRQKNLQPRKIREGCVPQLLFDVSELAYRDVHTGVQRVVRSLLQELMMHRPSGYNVLAVRADTDGNIRYANKFTSSFNKQAAIPVDPDAIVYISAGDIFFSADINMTFPFSSLQALRDQGLKVIFTVHDLFGLSLPDKLPKAYQLAFSDWLDGVLQTSDGVVCVSRTVADDLAIWLDNHPGQRSSNLPIGWFHHGADLENSKPTEGISKADERTIEAVNTCLTLLMVGTLEPRKGHAQALAAVDLLWQEGVDLNLVIVGKEGWRSHDLVRRLRRHPERNRRLFWLENASDALLIRLYAESTALLAASYAEGFGLPLIEAARHGLPIIARDIPVFHEVAGDFAFYFPDTDSAALADSLRQWLKLHAEGNAPQSKDMPYLTWAQSTRQLLKVILENDWYTTYQPCSSGNVSLQADTRHPPAQ